VTTPTTIHTPDDFIPQAPPGEPYLTLRDLFHAALQGLLSYPDGGMIGSPERFSATSYQYADAMLKARGQ
jgi:hypothetical protein